MTDPRPDDHQPPPDTDYEVAFRPARPDWTAPSRGLLAGAGFPLPVLKRAAGPPAPVKEKNLAGGLVRLTILENAFLAGPVLGAPLAVMALEDLLRRGAAEIIFVGLAGGLGPEFRPGDLICPESGLSTEGTSAHYPAPLVPDAILRDRLLAAGEPGEIAGGAVWSTDAIYRETFGLVAAQRARGARAVDMETTALWAAAAFRKARLAAILVVSDILDGRDHRPGFHRPEFKRGLARAAEIAWRALISDGKNS